jgi:hypothetical protein
MQGQIGVVGFLLEHRVDPRIKDARYQGRRLDRSMRRADQE